MLRTTDNEGDSAPPEVTAILTPPLPGRLFAGRPWLFAFLALLPILATEQVIERLASDRALAQERAGVLRAGRPPCGPTWRGPSTAICTWCMG